MNFSGESASEIKFNLVMDLSRDPVLVGHPFSSSVLHDVS